MRRNAPDRRRSVVAPALLKSAAGGPSMRNTLAYTLMLTLSVAPLTARAVPRRHVQRSLRPGDRAHRRRPVCSGAEGAGGGVRAAPAAAPVARDGAAASPAR